MYNTGKKDNVPGVDVRVVVRLQGIRLGWVGIRVGIKFWIRWQNQVGFSEGQLNGKGERQKGKAPRQGR